MGVASTFVEKAWFRKCFSATWQHKRPNKPTLTTLFQVLGSSLDQLNLPFQMPRTNTFQSKCINLD